MVYTARFTVPTSFFQIYDLNGAGITAVSAGYSNTYENAAIASDGTLLYVADVSVWNPTTQGEVGSISAAVVLSGFAHSRCGDRAHSFFHFSG